MMDHMSTILIVGQPASMRRALVARLSPDHDLVPVGEAGDAPSALECAEMLRPDLILLDAEIPGLNIPLTVPLLRERSPSSAIVIISPDPETARAMVFENAATVLGRDEAIASLPQMLRASLKLAET